MALPVVFKKRITRAAKAAILGVLCLLAGLVWYLTAPVEIALVVDGKPQAFITRAQTVGQLLAEVGLYVREKDIVSPGLAASIASGLTVELTRAFPVTIFHDGLQVLVYTNARDVESLLLEAAISLGPYDRVEPALPSGLARGDTVRITRVEKVVRTEEVSIPFRTLQEEDPALARGKRKVLEEGRAGSKILTYEIVLADGLEESRQLTGEEIVREPEEALVLLGSKDQAGKAREGLASWYGLGDGLHGARTASGEVFSRYDFTAAHLSLPFGTKVRVTFLRTGRSVEVRINDRGPHRKDRIIDLSMAAADAIGLKATGVGLVRVEVLR